MTVKAVYEDGVLKPKDPLPFKEHEEVEIDVRRTPQPSAGHKDPRAFVGFIKGGVKGMPVAAHHDKFIDQDQYGFLKAYFWPLAKSAEWSGLSREEKIERFARTCRTPGPTCGTFGKTWIESPWCGPTPSTTAPVPSSVKVRPE